MKTFRTLNKEEVLVPADVPHESRETYIDNYLALTHGTGNLMLYACDQKVEHLNDDFHGTSSLGPIPAEDNDPEHLFRIGSGSTIGVLAAQYGLITQYGASYPNINYLAKLNSKTHLVKKSQMDPYSQYLWDVRDVVDLKEISGLNIRAVGYTIYIGSDKEYEMMTQAAQMIKDAHSHGLLTVLWIYPRGAAVVDETDPHLIAGACGVACSLGSDFVKVNYPKVAEGSRPEAFKEAVEAGGRCGTVCAGGSSTDAQKFLQDLHDQIHISMARGNATGRNIHQKPLAEARRMCDAISAVTLCGASVEDALAINEGTEFKLE